MLSGIQHLAIPINLISKVRKIGQLCLQVAKMEPHNRAKDKLLKACLHVELNS